MRNLHRGFIAPLILLLVALLFIGGGAYSYKQLSSGNTQPPPSSNDHPSLPASTTTTSIKPEVSYAVGQNINITAQVRERVSDDCGGNPQCGYLVIQLSPEMGTEDIDTIRINIEGCVDSTIQSNDVVKIQGPIKYVTPQIGLVLSCGLPGTSVTRISKSAVSTQGIDLTGIKITGNIPVTIFQSANDYLISRLGKEYVSKNVMLAAGQSETPVDDFSHRVVFIDNRLTNLNNEQNQQLKYYLDVKNDGTIDQTWFVVPDCVKNPALCEINVTREQAIAKVSNTEYLKHPSVQIGVGRCDSGSEITSTEGFFWTFLSPDRTGSFQINMSTGAVNICKWAVGDF